MVEMAQIFQLHGSQYRAKYGHKMLPSHLKVMRAIQRCRTIALGGHVYTCGDCDETQFLYHSCRDRHCPKCQNDKAQLWLEKQHGLLLPTRYFLLTFTLPDELRRLARSHQKLFYALLFRASASATQRLAQDPRFIGGQIGMVGVLHTWGRNLTFHPHVHYLVPAGGLAADRQTWLPARKGFFLPVKALSRIFRAKFRDTLRKTDCFDSIPADVWAKDWVVHCQPAGSGLAVLKYLAPYIFRVAISNNRILKLSNGRVTFRFRATDTGKLTTCTLPALEFIRRFLQHVLPRGFVKVRCYDFLAHGRRKRLAALHQRLGPIALASPLGFGNTSDSSDALASITSLYTLPADAPCGAVRPFVHSTSYAGDAVLPDAHHRWPTTLCSSRSIRRQSKPTGLLGSACLATEKPIARPAYPICRLCAIQFSDHHSVPEYVHNPPHSALQLRNVPRAPVHPRDCPQTFCHKPQTRVELGHPA